MNSKLVSTALVTLFASALSAQVTHWRLVKGPFYEQAADNTPPGASFDWSAGVYLTTTGPGDATAVTISGGGIAGSLPLDNEGPGIWVLERDYATQAALNAEFPSGAAYTLTVSGGALGTLAQPFSIGAAQYPNVPYLTGSVFTTARQISAAAPFTFTWNNPGPLTQNSGVSVFSVFDRNDDEIYRDLTVGGTTASTVPPTTLSSDECYYGYLEFTHGRTEPGSIFGVAGTTSHNTAIEFVIGTHAFPVVDCAWKEEYGYGCHNLALDGTVPMLGTSWALTTTGITPGSLAFTVFALFPQEPPMPLAALGLNAPGCDLHIPPGSTLAMLTGVAVTGQITMHVALPSSSAFAGLELYAQTAAAMNVNLAGIALSNGFLGSLGH